MLACGGSVTGVEGLRLGFFYEGFGGERHVRSFEYAEHLCIYSSKHLNGSIS